MWYSGKAQAGQFRLLRPSLDEAQGCLILLAQGLAYAQRLGFLSMRNKFDAELANGHCINFQSDWCSKPEC